MAALTGRCHVDRPAVLLQLRPGRRLEGGAGGQHRGRHHQARRAQRVAVFPLGRRGDMAGGRGAARRKLPGGVRAAGRLCADRHGRVAGHDHAVQRVGADLAQPEEDPGSGARRATKKRRRLAPLSWPPASIRCCRSRCCSSWAQAATARCSSPDHDHPVRRRSAAHHAQMPPVCGRISPRVRDISAQRSPPGKPVRAHPAGIAPCCPYAATARPLVSSGFFPTETLMQHTLPPCHTRSMPSSPRSPRRPWSSTTASITRPTSTNSMSSSRVPSSSDSTSRKSSRRRPPARCSTTPRRRGTTRSSGTA